MNLAEFQKKLSASHKPVLVDFWAAWCVPCVVAKPVLEKLAKEYTERVEFLSINADEAQNILKHFGVFGIPTVVAFRGGEEVGRVVGAQNEANYRAMFEHAAGGENIQVSVTPFDRILRLGLGAGFIMLGVSASSWLMIGIGGVVSFLGIYDRCPMWNFAMKLIKNK